MRSGKNKGTQFEREICKKLSLWWSDGKDDAIFWRTSGSGARAKIRSKRNQQTFGQYGDIQATNPIGQPLIDLFSIEIKRGYGSSSPFDLIDRRKDAAQQTYDKFLCQAIQDCKNSGRKFWLLITKRNNREIIVLFPKSLTKKLLWNWKTLNTCTPLFEFYIQLHNKKHKTIYGTTLSKFLNDFDTDEIKNIIKAK